MFAPRAAGRKSVSPQTLMQRAGVSEAVLQATPNDYHLRVTPHYAVASLALTTNKGRIRDDRYLQMRRAE